jgi:MFS transporter, ACDE family, multidrug resistance protein
LVLQYFPVVGVFAASGLVLMAAWLVAARLHPQLGIPGASRTRNHHKA